MKNIAKKFLIASVGLSAVALSLSLFTRYIEAQLYHVYSYLKGSQPDMDKPKEEKNLDCPQLEKGMGWEERRSSRIGWQTSQGTGSDRSYISLFACGN